MLNTVKYASLRTFWFSKIFLEKLSKKNNNTIKVKLLEKSLFSQEPAVFQYVFHICGIQNLNKENKHVKVSVPLGYHMYLFLYTEEYSLP